jgi:NAD(P)H dehydrogenase (quinone)
MDRLLLISSSENGKRKAQHRNVINAAKDAGVGLIAYTSILRADTSPLFLAEEHRDTESALADAGVPFVLLRNGWYTEVHTWRLPLALKHVVFMGAAGEGRISSAARADYRNDPRLQAFVIPIVTDRMEEKLGRVFDIEQTPTVRV